MSFPAATMSQVNLLNMPFYIFFQYLVKVYVNLKISTIDRDTNKPIFLSPFDESLHQNTLCPECFKNQVGKQGLMLINKVRLLLYIPVCHLHKKADNMNYHIFCN